MGRVYLPDDNTGNVPSQNDDVVTIAHWDPLPSIQSLESKKLIRFDYLKYDIYENGKSGISWMAALWPRPLPT